MNLALKSTIGATREASFLRALSPEQILAALPADWPLLKGQRPIAIAVERVHFRGTDPAVIQYRLQLAGEVQSPMLLGEFIGANARDHAAAESERLTKRRRRQLTPDTASPVIALPAQGLVLRPAGIDAKLAGLRLLADARAARKSAARALDVTTKGWTPEVQLHAHRLGKRAVLQIDLSGPLGHHRVFARLRPGSNDSGARAFALHRQITERLANVEAVTVPRPLAYDDQFGAAFYSTLPGSPLNLTAADAPSQVGAALRALSAFHTHGPTTGGVHRPADEIALLQDWKYRIRAYIPALAPVFARTFDEVSAALDTLQPFELRPCHRDFHEGQVLIEDGRVSMLDFDTFRQSDPAMDLGNIVAHMRLAGLRTGRDLTALEAPVRALGARDRVTIWTRAALLRLACIYAFSTLDGAYSLELLDQAWP